MLCSSRVIAQLFPSQNSTTCRSTSGQGRLMATRTVFQTLSVSEPYTGLAECSTVLRSLALLIVLFLYSIPVRAQLQQPFIFTVDPANPLSIAVYARNDLTGMLTPVPGSPFPSKESVNVMTLDFKGRFLFTASFNPSKISMFIVDPNTGPPKSRSLESMQLPNAFSVSFFFGHSYKMRGMGVPNTGYRAGTSLTE